MSTDPETTRIVRSWLDEGVTVIPDRVLDAVLDQVPATPQRRPLWLVRRFPPMNGNSVRIALAAAAVLVVTLIGIQLLSSSKVGGPGPSQSRSPSLEPTPTPVPTVAAVPAAGPMAVGRHSMTLSGVPLSIELAKTGWTSNGVFGIDKGDFASGAPDAAGFILWPASAADNTFGDPCTATPLDPPAGPSVAQRAAAVSTVAGIELVSGPTAVTVGGYPAQRVVVRVPERIACAPDHFYLWYDADDPSGESARYATATGSTIYVWIIDVDGTIVWIDGETYATSGPEAALEVQQIVDSIRFE